METKTIHQCPKCNDDMITKDNKCSLCNSNMIDTKWVKVDSLKLVKETDEYGYNPRYLIVLTKKEYNELSQSNSSGTNKRNLKRSTLENDKLSNPDVINSVKATNDDILKVVKSGNDTLKIMFWSQFEVDYCGG